ncbi:agamous-like MADS-box protein AGL62 [Cynara cardunculus var. scolymus]|nr:agamous-like MADS-box protein AGL62 [Cynara cardunculus var. scolymus]
MPKLTKGRQKIEMKKIPDERNLAVTFSKRYSGIFKKASELCTLCGVDIAILIFSPTKKAFSFGHPCVETIIDRYLAQHPPPSSSISQFLEFHRNANTQELTGQLANILRQLEAEKKTGEELDKMKKINQDRCWWEAPIDTLGVEQLEQLKMAMLELKKNAEKQAERLKVEAANRKPTIPISDSTEADAAGPSMSRDMD